MRWNPETQVVQVEGEVEQELQGYEQSLQTPLTGTAWGLAHLVQKVRLLQVLHLSLQVTQRLAALSTNMLG